MWCAKATIVGRVNPRIPSFPDAPTLEDVRDEMRRSFFPLIPPIPPRLPHLPDPGYTSVDPNEVSAALSKCSNKSAPSPDHIPYGVLKNVHRASSSLIPLLLDPLLRWGVHPTTLKKSLGVVLPKPGKKDYSQTSSGHQVALIFLGGLCDFLSVFMGTPQGSPLSPLLFLIYVSGFHEECAGGVVFSYVDDFAITVFSRSYHTNAHHLERWAALLVGKAAALKLTFSLPKTELNHWHAIQQPSHCLNNTVTIENTVTTPSRFVR